MTDPHSGPLPGPIFLGIDTGGTYTDAVLWSEAGGEVLAKAKALTTRHDLAVGISGAVDAVMQKAGVDPAAIKLVSMSTTLATNALVEGQGGRVALVMIGFGSIGRGTLPLIERHIGFDRGQFTVIEPSDEFAHLLHQRDIRHLQVALTAENFAEVVRPRDEHKFDKVLPLVARLTIMRIVRNRGGRNVKRGHAYQQGSDDDSQADSG